MSRVRGHVGRLSAAACFRLPLLLLPTTASARPSSLPLLPARPPVVCSVEDRVVSRVRVVRSGLGGVGAERVSAAVGGCGAQLSRVASRHRACIRVHALGTGPLGYTLCMFLTTNTHAAEVESERNAS